MATLRDVLAPGTLLALAAALGGCGGGEVRPNVLLLSIDTLRADHLGCYGYERDTSPNLDRFAAESVRYADAQAPAPWTLPSHAAMLTGVHPWEMGVTEQDSSLPSDVQTLAERLADAGYQTAAFVDSLPGGFLGGPRGFARGFERFEHAPHRRGRYRYDMAATVEAASRWLATRDPERPFFLFLHTKSVHTAPADRRLLAESDVPYHKPPPWRGRFLPGGAERFRWTDAQGNAGVAFLKEANRRFHSGEADPAAFPPERLAELVGLYDGGIAYVDEHFGRLRAELERLGLAQDTLVVVTADHGEAFLDHGFFLHKEVYGPVLRVPLIVHAPGDPANGSVVGTPVSLLDVTPTVLARAGVEPALPTPAAGSPEEDVRGRVLPPWGAPSPGRALFGVAAGSESPSAAILLDGWKLVLRAQPSGERRPELYRAAEDPDDERPRSEPARETELAARLAAWLAGRGAGEGIELDEASRAELEALGYGD